MTYIQPPVPSDPDDFVAAAIAAIQAVFPNFNPAEGSQTTIILEAVAQWAAQVGTVASSSLTSVFRYLGPLVGIPPLDAAPASVSSTWTMVDDGGYTVPAGTLVNIPASGNVATVFETSADFVIASGSTSTPDGAVTLVASAAGAAGSGLGVDGQTVDLITNLAFVSSVTLTGATTGGVDAETDDAYLGRLASEYQLLSPAPILPGDFAALALSVAGVSRALALDGYMPAVNELESVTVAATSGTFTLTFSGQTTGTIAWNAAASVVQSALEALSNIAPGDVICTGGPLASAPVQVEFTGAYAGTNVTQMTANSGSLSGGSHTATVATTRNGSAATTGNARTISVAVADASGQDDTSLAKTAVLTLLQSLREVNFVVNVIDPTFTELDADFTVTITPGFDPDTVIAAGEAAVANWLNPAAWGQITGGDQAGWVDTDTAHLGDGFRVVGNVPGVQNVVTFTLALHGDSLTAADVTLAGPASLPVAGTITGAVA